MHPSHPAPSDPTPNHPALRVPALRVPALRVRKALALGLIGCLLVSCNEFDLGEPGPETQIALGTVDLSTHRDTAATEAVGRPLVLEVGRSEVGRTVVFQDSQLKSYVLALEAPNGTLLSSYAPEAPAEESCVQSGGASPAVKIARTSWRLKTDDSMLKDVRLIAEDRDAKGVLRSYPELWYAGADSRIDATLRCTNRDGMVTVWTDRLQLERGWNVVLRSNTTRSSASPQAALRIDLVSSGLTGR